jgi:hypothetical protein
VVTVRCMACSMYTVTLPEHSRLYRELWFAVTARWEEDAAKLLPADLEHHDTVYTTNSQRC